MKLSKYNLKVRYDDNIIILNKLSREYIMYPKDKEEKIDNILENLSQKEYSLEDAKIILKMSKVGIIVDDYDDEIIKLSHMINKVKYQDKKLLLVISPTMDCNFRCTYCIEERKETYMTEEVEENIIKFVENMSKLVSSVQVSWFGGEPTVVMNTVNRINKSLKEICDKNGCEYSITMTTNGYLLSSEVLDELKNYNIRRLQITVDGDQEHHDKRRMLANGDGTYNVIMQNINNAVDRNINILLRVNVDETNVDSINILFDSIPLEKRKKINIHISNLFQSKNAIKLYDVYKRIIDKGYILKYYFKQLQFCEGAFTNSFTIQPDGNIGPCQIGYDSNIRFGEITKGGNIKISNKNTYYKFKEISPLNDKECLACSELPVCLGGCPVARFNNNKLCSKHDDAGITHDEMLKLEVYCKIKNNTLNQECVI